MVRLVRGKKGRKYYFFFSPSPTALNGRPGAVRIVEGWMLDEGYFFLGSCRARSRLRRSSKRFVFDWQFPHVGEWVRAKS